MPLPTFASIRAAVCPAVCIAVWTALALTPATVAKAGAVNLDRPWPGAETTADVTGRPVTFPSLSPFSPADLDELSAVPRTPAVGHLFVPEGASAAEPVPAVIMLHGSGGVLASREMTYGAQFAAMGVAALVVDAFAARRDFATGFLGRLLEITETMLVADAYAGLRFLAANPAIDRDRIALVGFSYGAMASMYALNAWIAGQLAPDGLRFAAHAAYYGPCIARFEDPETTGAPLLMLWGEEDELIDFDRCQAFASAMRTGGSAVRTMVYPGALHQWDGAFARRPIGRLLNACDFRIEPDGTVRDANTGLPMSGPITRRITLFLCVEDRPYLIGRDDAVRARSNRDLGRFLTQAFEERDREG